jgi:DtxR family Mn-dependent transcriptional regulator
MQQREIEELLELIWTMREKNVSSEKSIIENTQEHDPAGILVEMVKRELIEKHNGNVLLTASGEKYAEKIIRRHRLAERLFKDLFKMEEENYEKEACTWEHVLSEEVTDSVCAFLGHPRFCPHNKPIPRGQCCFKYEKTIPPLVQPLNAFPVGTSVRIVYIATTLEKRLDRLSHLGIYPGVVIRLKQKRPALVVAAGETSVALDRDVGSEIFALTVNDTE